MGRFGGWHAVRQGLLEDSNVTLQRSWPYLKRCFPYILPYLKYVLGGSFCLLLQTSAGLLLPIITMQIIDKVIPQGTAGFPLLNVLILGWLGLALSENVLGVLQSYLFTYANQGVFHDFRAKLYKHIQQLPVSYFETNQTGSIMSRIINDVGALSGVFGRTFTDFAVNAIQVIGVTIAMFYYHPMLAVMAIIIAPFFALSFLLFKDKMRKIQKLNQEKWANMSASLQERLSGIRLIKAFVREKREEAEFTKASEDVAEVSVARHIISSLGGMITSIIGVLGPLVITWYGVAEIIRGNLTLGEYMAFTMWIGRLLGPSRALLMLLFGIQFSLGAAERVFEVLETPAEDEGKEGLIDLPEKIEGSLRLENVKFGYGDAPDVLRGIDMYISSGSVVALVGPSGAGKSTIAKLVLRFYPLRAGRILIDEIDIATVKLSSLRDKVGFIDQDTFLFNATVKENILYGKPDATDEEIVEASKAAYAHDFVMHLPEGYDTIIGERGVKLSGGQKQRLSIARTFLKNPSIIILDEATSSLDSESEVAIHLALDELMKGRTTVIISHRLATLQKADKIYVIDKGRIVEEGTHFELIEQPTGLYRHLFELQYLRTGNEETYEGFR